MKSFTINTRASSNLFALTVIALGATLLFTPRAGHTQQLQPGVSVQMAATSTAAPMPEADNQDAWIVAVTADGNLFFGIDSVTPAALVDKMKSRPRRRDQKLYIKVDARAPFTSVESVLEAARIDLFEAPVLLTSQPESATPGTIVAPKGLEVLVGSSLGPESIVVLASKDGRQGGALKINGQQIASAALQNTLMQLLQTRSEKVVAVRADGLLSFAEVIHVIDVCHSAGAKVVLPTPQP
jgi:biopolymer transport protein ExbD